METFNRAYSIKIVSLQRKQEHKTGGIVWGAGRWAGDHSVDYECHLSLRIRCSDDTAIGHTAISSKLDSRLTPTPPPHPPPTHNRCHGYHVSQTTNATYLPPVQLSSRQLFPPFKSLFSQGAVFLPTFRKPILWQGHPDSWHIDWATYMIPAIDESTE